MDIMIRISALFIIFLMTSSAQGITQEHYFWACANSGEAQIQCPSASAKLTIKLFSVSLYSTSDLSSFNQASCGDSNQCMRIIRADQDIGLSAQYKYFYESIKAACLGRSECRFQVPESVELIGEAVENYKTETCPQDGSIKFFTQMLIHYQCQNYEEIATVSAPPSTLKPTTPTTPTTTEPFSVVILFYQPILNDREKIILGAAIGGAIVILIVLLIILYCWERVRKQRKFHKLLRMLGRPQHDNSAYDDYENYGRKEAWLDETDNVDAIGEYTGVKPDEYMTIDRRSSGLIYDDFNGLTMTRGNSCATLSRTGQRGSLPDVMNSSPRGSADYNTEENLELERRMAAVLAEDDEEKDNSTETENNKKLSSL